jgi:outer membrane protein
MPSPRAPRSLRPRPPRAWLRSLAGLLLGLPAFVALGLVPGLARAQDARVAFIDSEKVVEAYSGIQNVRNSYQADVKAWNDEAENRKREIDLLSKELAEQGPGLSDEKLREKEQDYQRKVSEYESFVQSVWGPNGLVLQRNEESLRPVVRRIQTIVGEIAEERGYTLILDAADGNILYADPSLDLTAEVIQRLNGDASGTEGNPAGGADPEENEP